jgi:SAM-dependent methyltransferase
MEDKKTIIQNGKDFEYTGKDELASMEKMNNYNESIIAMIKAIISTNNPNIMDFGAGIGTLSKYFDKTQIICLEIDQAQRKELKTKGFKVASSITEIGDNSLDLVFSSNVFEHIEDDYKIAKELFAKVKPGGKIFIYVPAFPVLYSEMDKKVGHYRRYTKSRITDVLGKAGFDIVETHYSDSIGFFASLIFKYFGSKTGDVNEKQLVFYDTYIYPLSRFIDGLGAKYIFGKNIVAVGIKR